MTGRTCSWSGDGSSVEKKSRWAAVTVTPRPMKMAAKIR
jgi:hypothetical protein